MRKPFTKEFNTHYNNGFRLYLSGDWESALPEFESVLEIVPTDKPTKNLIKFMEQNGMKPPANCFIHICLQK